MPGFDLTYGGAISAIPGVRRLLAVAVLSCALFCVTHSEAEAMDPVTIATLVAPIVMPLIEKAMPYILKGGVNFFRGVFDMFVDMAGIVMLPIGLFETLFGAPFGLFHDGLSNLKFGAMALPKMLWSMCLIPLKTVGSM